MREKINIDWALVVAQLVEQTLPTPELDGSNPAFGKLLYTKICTVNFNEKMEVKKRGQNWSIYKRNEQGK